MAVHKVHMKSIILRNGHLKLEGDETTEELRMALRYLRRHTITQCKRPYLGTPIEALLPDISVIEVGSIRSQNVRNAADRRENA